MRPAPRSPYSPHTVRGYSDNLTVRGTVRGMVRLLEHTIARQALLTRPALKARVSRHTRHEPELRLVKHLLPAGGVLLDVGANHGTYVLAGLAAGAAVVAVEPVPELAAQLRFWFPSEHVSVVCAALSEIDGEALLHQPVRDGRPIDSRASLSAAANQGFDQTAITVETRTLDGVVSAVCNNRLDMVKIDVEGHEVAVLRSGPRTFTDLRPSVLVEVERRHHEENAWEAFELLHGYGYRGFFQDAARILHPLAEFNPDVHQPLHRVKDPSAKSRPAGTINNFLFVPEERSVASLRI